MRNEYYTELISYLYKLLDKGANMIKKIIEDIKNKSNCRILPSTTVPADIFDILPDDIKEFYTLCGGIILFEDMPYSARTVPPEEFVLANPVILGEEIINSEIEKGTYENEISKEWYIVADLYNSDYIVIDMNEKRKGKCYKAFWDSYPDEGDTPIISLSFTELLEKLSQNDGEYWFFLKKDFKSYGDAYDET